MTLKYDLILAIPPGKEYSIFPWGVHLISDYIENSTCNTLSRQVQIIDLSSDKDINGLFAFYKDDLLTLKATMKSKAKKIFSGNSAYSQAYCGVVGSLGGRFIDIANANNMYPYFHRFSQHHKIRNRLHLFKKKYDKLLLNRIEKVSSFRHDSPLIWGISTYDHTAFNALYFAKKIRQKTHSAVILLGGDYWDFQNAFIFMKDTNLVDGIIVGYGEQVLQKILNELSTINKNNFDQLKIVGLINKKVISQEKPRNHIFVHRKELTNKVYPFTQQTLNIPVEYYDQHSLPFRFVRYDTYDPTLVRILTQRGCSHGACTFCTQIDKFQFFNFPTHSIIYQLEQLFKNLSKWKKIKISIDSDEISETTLIALINCLHAHDDQFERLSGWIRVRTINNNIVKALLKAGNASKYTFGLNWESIDPSTLKRMNKGHTNLQAIAAAKAILDSGATFCTNYFTWFPKQDKRSKIDELCLLNATSHLLFGRFNGFFYSANRRDDLFHQTKHFGIAIKRNPYDLWLREVFQSDLEYSYWMYSWRTLLSRTTWSIIIRLYEIIISKKNTCLFPIFSLLFRSISSIFRLNILIEFSHFCYWLNNTDKQKDNLNVFCIDGNTLLRKSTAPIKNQNRIKIEIDNITKSLLRHAYWPITENQLQSYYSKHNNSEFKTTFNKLEKLGAIIRYDNKILSVVNDPDYWVVKVK